MYMYIHKSLHTACIIINTERTIHDSLNINAVSERVKKGRWSLNMHYL